jgi:hypothetical protein
MILFFAPFCSFVPRERAAAAHQTDDGGGRALKDDFVPQFYLLNSEAASLQYMFTRIQQNCPILVFFLARFDRPAAPCQHC